MRCDAMRAEIVVELGKEKKNPRDVMSRPAVRDCGSGTTNTEYENRYKVSRYLFA